MMMEITRGVMERKYGIMNYELRITKQKKKAEMNGKRKNRAGGNFRNKAEERVTKGRPIQTRKAVGWCAGVGWGASGLA
jgi:hypothetical protein